MLRRLIGSRRPKAGRDWEWEYSEGKWDLLSGMDEMARYWIVAGYCSQVQLPAILDVGCGPGVLEERLRLLPYGSYTGIDISKTALRAARSKIPESCRLVCADFHEIALRDHFDRIVFMESLESDSPVGSILSNYVSLLTANGRIVISLFDGAQRNATGRFWKEVRNGFHIEDATRVENLPTGKSWTIASIAAHRA